MALEATHIRFALDLKDKLGVSDVCQYLSGTIYPDSRYVTGIDRNLTHPRGLFERKHTELSDFEKGWLAHLICDDIQYKLTMERFPEIAQMQEGQGNGRWINHTALKILQDMDDVKKFDIKSHLYCLEYVENPNGEDMAKISEYNSIFPAIYEDSETMDIESYYEMWSKFNIGDDLVNKLRESVERQRQQPQTVELVRGLYDEMLDRAKAL